MMSIYTVKPNWIVCLCLLFACVSTTQAQPKREKIRLTGQLKEEVTIHVHDKTITLSELPYEFVLEREEIPTTIKIESPNYTYRDIDIQKYKRSHYILSGMTGEKINRTYVVYGEPKTVMGQNYYAQNNAPSAPAASKPKVKPSSVDKAPASKLSINDMTFALIIANEDYQMVAPVEMAEHDGEIFKKYCTTTLSIPEENIKYYPNATYGNMLKALNEIKDIADVFEGKINLLFYYAGHGIPDNATKDAYILPVDASGEDMRGCFSLKDIYTQIEELKLNNAVFFLDACFTGAQRGGDMIVAARGVAFAPKEEAPMGSTVVFSAASGQEAAYPYENEGHGLFTYFLLKKLQETGGKVTLGELAAYIKKNVAQKSIVANGKRQTPTVIPAEGMTDEWQDMPLIPRIKD